MAKVSIKPSEQLAYDIGTLIDGKPNAEILAVMCLVVANICLQSVAPDVIADRFNRKLKDMISEIRKEIGRTNKTN